MLRLRSCVLARILSAPANSPISPLHRLLSTAVPPNPSFAVEEYLVDTCGLTRPQARKASTKLSHLRSPSNPDAVLAFLAGLGLSGAAVAAAVAKDPLLLCASVERTLTPTLVGLTRLGLSHSEITGLVSLSPTSIRRKAVLPNLHYFMSLFGSFQNLLPVLRNNSNLHMRSLEKVVKPNVAILQERGLGAGRIAELCLSYPWLLSASVEGVHAMVACGKGLGVPAPRGSEMSGQAPLLATDHLERVQAMVACTEALGVPRGSVMFRHALHAVVFLGEEKIAAKVEHLKSTLRWSDAEVGVALSKLPHLLMCSKDSVRRKSEFLISEVGLEPAYMANRPSMLCYSLEGRLRPRYYVFRFLKANGLLHQDRDYYAAVTVTEKVFRERFVCPHKEAAPHLAQDFVTACAGEVPTSFGFALTKDRP